MSAGEAWVLAVLLQLLGRLLSFDWTAGGQDTQLHGDRSPGGGLSPRLDFGVSFGSSSVVGPCGGECVCVCVHACALMCKKRNAKKRMCQGLWNLLVARGPSYLGGSPRVGASLHLRASLKQALEE